MKTTAPKAFTLVELLVSISIIMILASMLLVSMASARAKSRQTVCLNNLHQLGLGFTGFALDHEGKYPMDVPERLGGSLEHNESRLITNTPFSRDFRHFLTLSNEVPNVKIMVCPADRPRRAARNYQSFTNENLSYWVNPKALPHATLSYLAGDWNVHNTSSNANDFNRLDFGREVHRRKGSVLFADGRVEITRTLALQSTVTTDPVVATAGAQAPTPAPTTAAPAVRRPANPAPPTAVGPIVAPTPGTVGGAAPNIPEEKKAPIPETVSTNKVDDPAPKGSEGQFNRSARWSRTVGASDPPPPALPQLPPGQSAGGGYVQQPAEDPEPWDTPGFRLFKSLAILSYLFSLLWAIIALLLLYLRARIAQRQEERAAAIKMD